MRRMLAIVAVTLSAIVARAGDLPSAGSATSPVAGDSHAWIADRNILGGVKVLHLPPRGEDAAGHRGVADGAVRIATVLTQMPEAMAAVDTRLYLVFPPAAGVRGEAQRQVLMLEAERGALDGTWTGDPGDRRLPAVSALPGDCHLQGFAGSPAGPVALLDRPGSDAVPVEELLLLTLDGWKPVPLPAGWAARPLDPVALQSGDTGVRVVGTGEGVRLVLIDGPSPGAWTTKLESKRGNRKGTESALAQVFWSWEPFSFEDAGSHQRIRPPGSVWSVAGQLVFDRRSYQSVELWAVSAKGCEKFATAPRVESPYGAAPLDQTGRFAVTWSESPATGTRQIPSQHVFEVSTRTGQVFFDGEAAKQLPISSLDVKILAVFLVCVMLAIVVFVLRPDKARDPLILPKGTSLVDPGRRAIAGAIDATAAVIIATQLTRIELSEALTLEAMIRGTQTLWLMLATIGIGFTLGTLGEWLFGRSFGKALTGCEVAVPKVTKGADGEVIVELGRVSLWRAAVRNIVKWLIPPVAMSGVSSAEGRHRGDTAANTVVIIRAEPDEE